MLRSGSVSQLCNYAICGRCSFSAPLNYSSLVTIHIYLSVARYAYTYTHIYICLDYHTHTQNNVEQTDINAIPLMPLLGRIICPGFLCYRVLGHTIQTTHTLDERDCLLRGMILLIEC